MNSVAEIESGKGGRNTPIAFDDVRDGDQLSEFNMGEKPHLNIFERWMTVWVFLAMAVGTAIGSSSSSIGDALEKATYANVWLPGSILVWCMTFPATLAVRWSAIREIPNHPRGLVLTTFINWLVQPIWMYGLAILFFNIIYRDLLDAETQDQYVAGAVLLGGSPCTAMVFVWSSLAYGDPNYTLVQVLLNDILLLILYVPTAKLLLSVSDIALPWDTVFISVVLFVVVPFIGGMFTQMYFLRQAGGPQRLENLRQIFQPIASVALLLLVFFIFISQAQIIIANFRDVFLIMAPLMLHTGSIFVLTYSLAFYLRLRHDVAGPAAFIGSSNFFELAVGIAITVYGPSSGAVLVTIIGVLVECPAMLLEVAIVNSTSTMFNKRSLMQTEAASTEVMPADE